ncbi:FAD-binding and (Fe-S)-binding domain-containing protein [Sessilibacter sp. MAH4]
MTQLDSGFYSEIKTILKSEQIIEDITRRRALATDASFYQLIPELVLKLDTQTQVQQVLRLCHHYGVAVTFRAAGTSLSGQAVTDSVLIVLSDQWRGHEILDDGERIRLQPGVVGADANRYLKTFKRKIGPDPASINACKIGGIVANNASGMCCGVSQNTYYTMQDMTIILADGSRVDTSDAQSVAEFTTSHAELLSQLKALGDEVKADTELADLIRHKYRLKNTTGYAINSLVDFDDPLDILKHLMVGSEGTLGFVADVVYKTVVEHEHKASGLFLFATAQDACKLVAELSRLPVDAVELLDQRALNSVKGKPGLPDSFCDNPDSSTALLIETRAANANLLQDNIQRLNSVIDSFKPTQTISFSTDTVQNDKLWAIRKATFPAVGAVRKTGTTVIIEDVAFPIDKMDEGLAQLQKLFDKYGYSEAIIFGHALAGNLHFVFTQSFETQAEIERYDQFMQDVAQLVAIDLKGSLKAEHGTGRNMAPFVELEWGAKAYLVMQKLKTIIDPELILNPGVILNKNPQAHISDLKELPAANDIVDKCIECGFCEPVCPSRDLTLTPRQRISLWRRIQKLNAQPSLSDQEQQELSELTHSYQYYGVDTCAATGLCAQRCPVGINTGDLIRDIRAQNLGKNSRLIAKWSAENFSVVTKITGVGLAVSGAATRLLGADTTNSIGKKLHSVSDKVPLWYSEWPTKAETIYASNRIDDEEKTLVYFPSCASRTMGPAASDKDQRSQFQVAKSVFAKAGYKLIVPDELSNLCCGTPFSSKGLPDLAQQKANELIKQLKIVSQDGELPIVFDTSPCRFQIAELAGKLKIYETFEFIAEFLLDELEFEPTTDPVALHVTCSTRKMGGEHYLRKIAKACSNNVIEPEHIECCGFAGDKGMFVPELNQQALKPLKQQLPDNCTQGYSNSRTCEIGLSHHAGIPYKSLMYLLDSVTSEKTEENAN